MEENTNCENTNYKKVIEDVLDLKKGMYRGHEISKLAKLIHPESIAVIPLYMSCIVIIQNEDEKAKGLCTIHSYADPDWLGEDLNIDTLKEEDFHTEFKIRGQRSSPEIVYEKNEKTVCMSLSLGFDYLEKIEKEFQEWCKRIGIDREQF